MTGIDRARAITNGEVAFLAWETSGRLDGCLGFEIVRHHLADDGSIEEAVPLAAYVAFHGQSNPDWRAQNTSVWPVQKFTWRDLTLRKRRDRPERRAAGNRVGYAIRPVCARRDGLEPVEPRREGSPPDFNRYEGEPLPLSYLSPATVTDPIEVTTAIAPFVATFTNGILSSQWLVRALEADDGKIGPGELKHRLISPGDAVRTYLAGDVPGRIAAFFDRPGGRFGLALYELDDVELLDLVLANAERIDLVLSNTGPGQGDDEEGGEGADKVWDARNAPARRRLIERAAVPGTGFRLHHRMFNNSVQIGHNKFAVWSDDGGPRAVLTGSTNWTWSGLTAQSNNCIEIDDPAIAGDFHAYWRRLVDDVLPLPDPLGRPMPGNRQGVALRASDTTTTVRPVAGGTSIETWFSPNMVPRKYGADPETPPDLGRVFSLMRRASRAIFFLAFYPSQQGRLSIVEQAVRLGLADPSLLVVGAVSAAEAMFNFRPKSTSPDGRPLPAERPFVYRRNHVSVVRAAAIDDGAGAPIGDFRDEILKAGNAIIHDKILVIDPLDPENCAVVFGSHNLGFKASYSNDENLTVVRGHRRLAEAYVAHVLDVYDHYRFRAAEAELRADGRPGWDGFLDRTDAWQDRADRTMSRYFSGG